MELTFSILIGKSGMRYSAPWERWKLQRFWESGIGYPYSLKELVDGVNT